MTNKYIMVLLAIFCTLLWGSAFPAIKAGYKIFDVNTYDVGSVILFAGIRFTLGGIMVFIYGFIENKENLILYKNDIFPLSTLGFIQTFMCYLFLYIGVSNVTGTKTSILNSLSSFIVVILSPLFFKNDKINFRKILGCICGIAGITVVNLNGNFFDNISFFGDGFVILSVICSAVSNIYIKKISQKRSSVKITAYQLLIGGVFLIIVGIAVGGNIVFNSVEDYLLMLYMAFISAGAFVIWTELLTYNDASKVCIFNLLIPIFGTMWSGIFLKEDIFSWEYLLSLVAVCLGIFVVNYKSSKTQPD